MHRFAALAVLALPLLLAAGDLPSRDPAVDLVVDGPATLVPGADVTFRVLAFEAADLGDTRPVQGEVEVALLREGATLASFRLPLGAVRFRVPDAAEGAATLRLTFRDRTVESQVTLKRSTRVLLTTDKPLYQPGQKILIRALALAEGQLRPVAEAPVTFEVEDSRGNKVFKRTGATSAYGIAHTEFQLADEVNEGEYRIRAQIGNEQTERTVEVKRYVLPKFKVELSTDQPYYEPGQKVRGSVQVDYFFGKPVAGGQVILHASTFDVEFREFATVRTTTSETGGAEFEFDLPAYMIGQPLEGGRAVVKIEAEVIDTADHTEKKVRMVTVSQQSLDVAGVPEAGQIRPGLDNRIYLVVTGADDEPVVADLEVTAGGQTWNVRSDEAGLATVALHPTREMLRQTGAEYRQHPRRGWIAETKSVLDVDVTARATDGRTLTKRIELSARAEGDQILLRLDRALYRAGQTVQAELLATQARGPAYIDVVRAGQTVLTAQCDIENGRASYGIAIPADLWGTLEVHAYLVRHDGDIVRDRRVVYVNPAEDVQVRVTASQETYRPAETATLRFEVLEADGRGVPAALGLILVDEAIYALSELHPGLEKVYFTLEKELSQPQVELHYGAAALTDLPVLHEHQNQVAQVLLSCIGPPEEPADRVSHNSLEERYEQFRQQTGAWAQVLAYYAYEGNACVLWSESENRWTLRPDLIDQLRTWNQSRGWWGELTPNDPWGNPITIDRLTGVHEWIAPDRLAAVAVWQRLVAVVQRIQAVATLHDLVSWDTTNSRWVHRDSEMDRVLSGVPDNAHMDLRGRRFTWVILAQLDPFFAADNIARLSRDLRARQVYQRLIEVGRRESIFATDPAVARYADNVLSRLRLHEGLLCDLRRTWTMDELIAGWPVFAPGQVREAIQSGIDPQQIAWTNLPWDPALHWFQPQTVSPFANANLGVVEEGRGFGGVGGRRFRADAAEAPMGPPPAPGDEMLPQATAGEPSRSGAAAPRIREFFPETLYWNPEVITDEHGVATLEIPLADSITTWRMTGSAVTLDGRLGSVGGGVRVFQDFFADIDFPVALTQNDIVSVPVAVYNYLPDGQTVRLVVEPDPWYELLDDAEKSVELAAGEVRAVYFRLRARRIGRHSLTVQALGRVSDALRRDVEVLPDGQRFESAINGTLTGTQGHDIDIPTNCVEGTPRIFFKVYPGILSQILEGMDGMLGLPGG